MCHSIQKLPAFGSFRNTKVEDSAIKKLLLQRPHPDMPRNSCSIGFYISTSIRDFNKSTSEIQVA